MYTAEPTTYPVLSRLTSILKTWEDTNHQVLIKFRQTWSKQEVVIHYVLRSINLLILFGIRKNCHSSGSNPLLLPFVKWEIKWAVIIIEECNCFRCIQNFTQFSCIMIKAIRT
jgi:hypothetical protein